MNPIKLIFSSLLIFILVAYTMNSKEIDKGIFKNSDDVGNVQYAGSTSYDPNTEIYTLRGSGTNMWFGKDEFHFAWLKMKGNAILNTQVEFNGDGVDPHRKAGLIIRESLKTGSPYVSAAYHGDGLVSMQYRLKKDSTTLEFKAKEYYLPILQLVVHDNVIHVQAAAQNNPL